MEEKDINQETCCQTTPSSVLQQLQQNLEAAQNQQQADKDEKDCFLTIDKFGQYVANGLLMPEPEVLYQYVVTANETTMFFGDTGTGKSTYAMQMAIEIAEKKQKTVLYVNFELSQQQLALRFKQRAIPEQLFIATVNYGRMADVTDQSRILAIIEERAIEIGAEVIFIDNLTNLCINSKDGAEAGNVMLKLLAMRMAHQWTLVVIAHVPKRKQSEPMTLNDMAGSKNLSNLADNVVGFNCSKRDKNTRYIIQLKWRSGPLMLDAHNVQEMMMKDSDGWLHFEYGGRDEEFKHLPRSRDEKEELEREIVKEIRANPKKSYRDIATDLGTNLSRIYYVAKANKLSRSDKE